MAQYMSQLGRVRGRVGVRCKAMVGVRVWVSVRVRVRISEVRVRVRFGFGFGGVRARVRCAGHRRRHSSWKAWLHGVRSHRCPCSHASWQMEHTCEAGGVGS